MKRGDKGDGRLPKSNALTSSVWGGGGGGVDEKKKPVLGKGVLTEH